MLQLTHILGYISDPDFSEQLHRLEHAGKVETIVLARAEAKRHRLRVTTDRGTDVARQGRCLRSEVRVATGARAARVVDRAERDVRDVLVAADTAGSARIFRSTVRRR